MKKLLKRIMRFVFTHVVKVQVKSYEKHLRVNFFSKVTQNTALGENVNFKRIDN